MSGRILNLLIVGGVGVGTGWYIFQPFWKEVAKEQRMRQLQKDGDLGPNLVEIPTGLQDESKEDRAIAGTTYGQRERGQLPSK